MYKSLLLILLLLLSFCSPSGKNDWQEELPLSYPVYQDCNEALNNEEKWNCLTEKLAIFFHYQLTHEHAKEILNREDSMIVWMEIDTIGKIYVQKIIHTDSIYTKKTDSTIKNITQKIPGFLPAKRGNQKIVFRFKMPVVLTK